MHLNHVGEIDTSSEFLLNLLLCWTKLSILSCFQMELYKLILEPLKDLIVIKSIGGE